MKNKNQNQDLKNEYNFGELKFESPVNFENKSLEEIKQLADDTFRESKIKRRLLRAGIGVLTIGAATMAPLAVYQYIIPVKVSMKSTNENIKGYEVKLQRGSRVSEIKIVEIEGYDFIGFFKDKNCTIKYTGTEELNKNSVIYTSYKLKEYTVTIPTSDKYLLTTSGIVYHGEDFTFSVYPQEGYDLTNTVVKVGEKTLTPLEGVYTISNVTSDLEVSITGIEKIKYAITLTESDNCSVNIPSYIEHDEDLMFSVTPDTGYNAAHVVVKVNGVEVTPNSSGVYVVKNVKKLLNISVTGIEKNIYNVTTSGDKEHYTVNTVSSVEYGDDLKFTITPNVGYSLDDILVKVNGEIVIPVNGVYTVEHVEEDVDIKVISEFNVSVIGDPNYTVNVVDSINYFEDLIFNITPKTGYTLDDIIVKANGEVLTSIGGFYTIEDITEDVVIEVFGKYTVNTTGDVNYTVDVVNSIYYGEDLTFTITPKAGYTLNNILVKVNGQEVTGNQGYYTIENISEDITIEVLGAYQIKVNGDENCDVDVESLKHYGEKLTFTITPKEGYKLDHLTVKVNNQPITSDGGIYTVENVTKNITIDISGVEIIVFSVYVTGDEHCIVDVVDSINYGENLTFEIYAKNDCSIEDIEVKVNGQRIIPVGGIYTVENVKTDISILITGGAYVHTVSVVGNENCTVHVVNKILSGQDLNFSVTPKTGYTLEEMVVTVNNVVVELDEDDGFYTFENVSEDITIVITGVKLITYKVNVTGDENYTVNVANEVSHGQNLTFTITPDIGYSSNSLIVKVNGVIVTAIDGVYTVENMTCNVNIQLSGDALINYSINVTGNENCTVDVVEFIEFGRDLTFTITSNEGYKFDNAQVTVNGDVITAVSEENGIYTYTVTNVTEDITIVVTGVKKITNGLEIQCYNCNIGGNTYTMPQIEYGKDYTFTVTANEGYYLDDSCLIINDGDNAYSEITYTGDETERIYTITNITGEIYISINAKEREYNVTMSYDEERCTISPIVSSVDHGEDLTFIITPNTDYKLDNVQVTVNGNKITPVSTGEGDAYTYTVTNVTEEITIVVTGVDKADRYVEIEFSNCSSSGSTYILGPVEYGGDYTFTVEANEGFYLDDSCFEINAIDNAYGEVTYTGDEYSRTYTITNITGEIYISINAKEREYNVTTYSYSNEYTITADNKILQGSTLSFTISPQLEFANVMVTNARGDLLQHRYSNGTYYVDNVTSDVEIRIEMFENDVYITAGEKQLMDLLDWEQPYTNYLSSIQQFMDYNTNGVLYTDEACTQVADLTKKVGYLSRLYSKPATLDKLTFTWDNSTSSYRVSKSSTDISGEVVIPNKYKDSTNDGYVTTLSNDAFSNCTGLTSIEIPASVTTINDFAFDGCSGLTSIEIPASVTTIDGCAFTACSGLTSITVAEGNQTYYSENNCLIETATKTLIAGCKTSTIPNDITIIGDNAFYGCEGLTEIEIPASVITIEGFAFADCVNLTKVIFAENCQVESFGYECFSGCGITELIVPDSVTNLGGDSFNGCNSLTTVVIGNGAKEVYAFNYCDNLKTITIGSGVKSLRIYDCPKLETVNFVNTVGWQKYNYSTEEWEDADASELSDLVKAGTELRCEMI